MDNSYFPKTIIGKAQEMPTLADLQSHNEAKNQKCKSIMIDIMSKMSKNQKCESVRIDNVSWGWTHGPNTVWL